MKLYNLDECGTSKLNYKTEEISDNLYLPNAIQEKYENYILSR
jgi:hypothetical protein